MTVPRQSREDRSADQLLAGKYVLGLLSEEIRRDCEIRLRRDPSFARMVMQWSDNMGDHRNGRMFGGNRRAPAPLRPGENLTDGRRPARLVVVAWQIWTSAQFWRTTSVLLFFLALTLLAA